MEENTINLTPCFLFCAGEILPILITLFSERPYHSHKEILPDSNGNVDLFLCISLIVTSSTSHENITILEHLCSFLRQPRATFAVGNKTKGSRFCFYFKQTFLLIVLK